MAANTEGAADVELALQVETAGGKVYKISMPQSASVLELKMKLAAEEFGNIPVKSQRLVYSGRVLKNDCALRIYNISVDEPIRMVKSATSNLAATSSSHSACAIRTTVPHEGHLVPREIIDAPQSEEQMVMMLLSPAIVRRMNEVLDNQAFIDHLIQSHPDLSDTPTVRRVLQSPFFRHVMTSPEVLRKVAQMTISADGNARPDAFPAPGTTAPIPGNAPLDEKTVVTENSNKMTSVPSGACSEDRNVERQNYYETVLGAWLSGGGNQDDGTKESPRLPLFVHDLLLQMAHSVQPSSSC